MTDIIQAGIEIDVTGVDRGEVALKRLAQAGEQVDKSFERGAKAAKGAGDATAQAGREADKSRSSFSRFTQETKRMAGASGSASKGLRDIGAAAGEAERSVSVMGSALKIAKASVISFAAGMVTGAFKNITDEATDLESRLTQVAGSSDKAIAAMDRLRSMARNTYSDFANTTESFLSMSGSLQDLGYSTNQQLDYIESLNNALVISGAKAENAASVQNALSKAMALGKLSGDELNTVIATGGRVAQLLAEKLGTTVSGLRALGSEGKITSGVLYGALAGSLEKVRAEAEAMPATIGDGMLLLGDSVKKSVVEFDKLFGISSLLSDGLVWLADNIKVVVAVAAGAGAALAIAFAPAILASVVAMGASVVSLGRSLAALMYSNPFTAIAASIAAAATALTIYRHEIKAGIDDTTTLGDIGAEVWSRISGSASTAASEATSAIDGINESGRKAAENQEAWWLQAARGIAFTFDAIGAVIRGFFSGTYDVAKAVIQSIGNDLAALGQAAALALRFDFDGAKEKLASTFQGMDIGGIFSSAMEASMAAQSSSGLVAGLDSILEGAKEQSKNRIGQAGNDIAVTYVDGIVDGVRTGAASVAKATAALDLALKEGRITKDQYSDGIARAAAAHRAFKGALDETTSGTKGATAANNEAKKALKELGREQEKNTKSAIDAAKALSKGNDELRNEINSIGKTKRELVAMEQQRNNVTAAALKEAAAVLDVSIAQDKELGTTKDLIALKEKERDAILEQVDLIGERNRLLGERIDTEEVYESQKKIADKWQSLSDDMGRTFTDAIIQGGANAKEAIKRMFTNMVLRPIIEPIAQGVANMFTGAISGMFGGGQGGGLGGMLGGMFGGGGSSGGSFGFGSMLQAGQSIYSAATGWGKAMFTGFAEGGFTGAMQGLGSYFGGITAKIGSWFGGGAASGAAGGVGFGIGQPLVSGGVGSASYAGGSSMFSGLAAAWPLAVAMGILQSGKLYDAGVRADPSEMWKSTQGNFLGKIGNVAPTAMSALFKGIDSILKPIVGGKVAAMISGSTFHQALWTGINKKLFGGSWKTKDVGIGLGFDGGEFSGQQFEYRKKKGGLFSSSKKKTIWTAMDEEVHDALSEAMAESVSGTKGLFEALGFEIADDALSGLKTGIKQISTMGKDEEKIQEEISDWLSETNEAVAGELHKVLGTGLDLDLEGLTNFVLNLMGVNEILGVLGLNAYESSVAGAELAETLSALAGGLENLSSASDVYYKNFFSAEEQFEHSFAAMEKALDDAGLSAIESREAYRQAVEGLDLTTESGQEMFATMMGLAGVASDYFSILEAQAAEIAAYNSQLDVMKEALSTESVLAYTMALEALQADFDAMSAELEAAGLATDENIATLEQFRQKMAEMAALDLFDGGQSMADALRQGLMGTWDGEAIGDYLARSISDGVYGAIAGQFANQITDILLQGIVAPMINAALTGAAVSEAVTKESIAAIVAQAQAVAQVASEVMGALKESGVMDELQKALGGGFTLPKADYTMPAYRPPAPPAPVDDSWKRLLESIIKQTERAQQQIADMGRTTYEKGLAAIASTVADYQAQIAQSTASKRKQLTAELVLMEQAERKLLEAQMDQRAADMLAGLADELERMGKTDAELAIMNIEKQTLDYIKSLQDVGRATAGNIAQVEAWSQAMKDAAAKDAQIKAASGAFDALGRAVDAQRSVITEALELARDVADAAGSAAKDLFANVLGASDASAAQARAFISDALSTARSTGYLPDGDKLREAIDSATRGLDDAAAVSLADASWQKLVLANQLKELADLAEPQVDYAQSQLDALDNMLQNAQDQLNVLQGIDNSVLTVAEALSRFNEVVGNGQIITPESPVFTPEMPPQQTAPDNRAQEVNAELVAEVIELRNYMREIQRETKRTADAVNGRGDAPMLVETV